VSKRTLPSSWSTTIDKQQAAASSAARDRYAAETDMNIKFSSGAVRCRVSRAELDRLLAGRAIAFEVPLPPRNHVFRANIWPGALSGWQLESDPTGIWITIPKAELQTLAESLPSKEGIEKEFEAGDGAVTVSLEVDVRDRSKSAPG
jgi:hypothetical protein